MKTTTRENAERLVRQSVESLHAQLDIELSTRQLDDVSTLGEIAIVLGLAVALVARRTGYYDAKPDGFHVEAEWSEYRSTVANEAVGIVIGADAEPWVAEWLRSAAGAELDRQAVAWRAMKHGRMVGYAKALLDKMGMPNVGQVEVVRPLEAATTPVDRLAQVEAIRHAAHPHLIGPVERTCRVVEAESRIDGRCACHNLPPVMRPCERCEVSGG